MAVRDEVLVREAAHGQTTRARPAGRDVDQRHHLRAVEHHPALLRTLRVETQLGCGDPAQRQLLRPGQDEPGPVEVHRVPEPPVVQPHGAPALEDLGARPGDRAGPVRDAVRGSGALVAGLHAHPRLGHVQRALHAELRGVQRAPSVHGSQPAAAQAQRTPDRRPAQAQLAAGLDHLGLQVLRHAHPVADEGAAPPVGSHGELVDQQVRADLRVGQPDAPLDPAAR